MCGREWGIMNCWRRDWRAKGDLIFGFVFGEGPRRNARRERVSLTNIQ
jgi:hypothetical protein